MADDPPEQHPDYFFESLMEQEDVTKQVADILSRFKHIFPQFEMNVQQLSSCLINSISDYIESELTHPNNYSRYPFELRLPMLIAEDETGKQEKLFQKMEEILRWFMIHWFKNLDREKLVVEQRVDRSETHHNNRAVRREGGAAKYIAVRFSMHHAPTQFGFGVYMVRQNLAHNDPGDDRIFLTFEIFPLPDESQPTELSQDLLSALRSLHVRLSALEYGARKFT